MDKIWITRIKGHISGPFNSGEILKMIESKKLSIKDEVNKSLKQWVYVQNASELDISSSQTTTKVPLKKKDSSAEKTDMEDTIILDSPLPIEESEETQTAQVIEQKKQTALSKELNLEQAEVIDYKAEEFSASQKSSVQFETMDQVRKKASITSRKAVKYLWMLLALSAGAWIFFKYNSFFSQPPTVFEVSKARIFFQQGEYHKALEMFKTLPLENDSDRLHLASLLVQLEGDAYQAQIHLNKINSLPPSDQSRLQILKGIMAHKNNDTETAQTFFNEALYLSPFLGALHKILLNIQNPKQALSILNQIDFSNEQIKNNQNLLLLLKNYLEPPDKFEDLKLSVHGDYRQEILLLLLRKQMLSNQKESYDEAIKQILDQDPYLTQEYKNDILSPTPLFIWKTLLLDICLDISAQGDEQSHFIALKSLCLAQSGLNIEAMKTIEQARTQSPRDPLINSLYVFISSQNNLDKDTLLDYSLKQNKSYKLPIILKARFCQMQKDVFCTHSRWSQIMQMEPQPLSAITGSAWSFIQMGKKEEAQKLIQTGFSLTHRYKPLLQLKNSL